MIGNIKETFPPKTGMREKQLLQVGQTEAGYGALPAPTVVLLVVYVTVDIY